MSNPHDQERSRPYPTPQHLTLEGMEAFRKCIEGRARDLAAELDYQAVRDANGGPIDKQTAEIVRGTAKSLDESGGKTSKPKAGAHSADALMATAGLGPAIVTGLFSDSLPLVLVSIGFALLAVIGLMIRWRLGR